MNVEFDEGCLDRLVEVTLTGTAYKELVKELALLRKQVADTANTIHKQCFEIDRLKEQLGERAMVCGTLEEEIKWLNVKMRQREKELQEKRPNPFDPAEISKWGKKTPEGIKKVPEGLGGYADPNYKPAQAPFTPVSVNGMGNPLNFSPSLYDPNLGGDKQ